MEDAYHMYGITGETQSIPMHHTRDDDDTLRAWGG